MATPPINLFDYERLAKQLLSRATWDYVDAGEFDEITVRRNRIALDAVSLRPGYMADIRERDLSTTVLGTKLSFPVMLAACGGQGRCHEDAEKASAAAATSAGIIFATNTGSKYSLEEVAEAAKGPLWFQLYHQSREHTEDLVHRAEEAGYVAVCLTVDVAYPTRKERDIRHVLAPGGVAAEAARPVIWDPPLTWSDLPWLRSLTSLPIILKGIRKAEDAKMCVEHGIEGVYVSNHGGRQVDGTLSAIETLPEVVDAVNGRAEVYMDSGVRRGADVLRALALGAKAVGIGRPMMWGLAVAGQAGVQGVLEHLRYEVDRAMAYCGVATIGDITRSLVSLPGESGWVSMDALADR